MKLQIALDMAGLDEALAILADIGDTVDIVEVGTPWIIREGIRNVTILKEKFPALSILADLKIMDAGKLEAGDAFEAGADIVTVMAVAHDPTVAGAVEAAEKHGGAIMADLLATADPAARALDMERLGVRHVCVHTAFDLQASGCEPLEELIVVSKAVTRAGVAVAGGVNLANLPEIARHNPGIVVVGGSLTNLASPERRDAALKMKAILDHA